jgi:two-component system LytT family response regulator
MDKIRTLIVDDEPVARRRIRSLLQDGPEVEVVGECSDGLQAISAIQAQGPNLLLLDVQLPEVDGFGVLQSLSPQQMPAVIFMTNYDQPALRMFEAHGLEYLVKPFDRQRLLQALTSARLKLQRGHGEPISPGLLSMMRDLHAQRRPLERFRIRSQGRVLLLRSHEVDWIDSVGNYARLHVGAESHRLRERLKELEVKLDPGQFMRIHRSTIINIDRIKELQQGRHREYYVVLADGTRLSASRSYNRRLRQVMG